jgi:hypothetical protein
VTDDPLARLRAALEPAALTLVGVADAADARALHAARGPEDDPFAGAASVVVVASGGRCFWERLPAAARAGEPHPIDRIGREAIAAALPALPGAWLLAEADQDRVDLRRLAERCGLGVVSPYLELLIHPTFGPWVSVRGVVASPAPLAATPGPPFDPCGPCPRPCLAACPVGAYRPGARFDVLRCAAHRLASDDAPPPAATSCADRCHARLACVVGVEHAYGPDELRHRHRAGLPTIRAWAGRQSTQAARGG